MVDSYLTGCLNKLEFYLKKVKKSWFLYILWVCLHSVICFEVWTGTSYRFHSNFPHKGGQKVLYCWHLNHGEEFRKLCFKTFLIKLSSAKILRIINCFVLVNASKLNRNGFDLIDEEQVEFVCCSSDCVSVTLIHLDVGTGLFVFFLGFHQII